MLKKIILLNIMAVLLTGAEILLAEEKADKHQVGKGQIQRLKAQPQQLRRQRAGQQDPDGPAVSMQLRRRQRAGIEAGRRPMDIGRDKPQFFTPEQERPGPQMFARWFDELTKAYKEKDNQRMGQLIRKMHQLRQKWQDRVGTPDRPGPVLREKAAGRPGVHVQRIRPGQGAGRAWKLRGGPGKRGWAWQGRGMCRWDRGVRGRRMGMWGQGMRTRGMMSRRGRGFPPRGMGRGRPEPGTQPSILEQQPHPPRPPQRSKRPGPDKPLIDVDEPALTPKDRARPGPGMPLGHMGGRGRGFQPVAPRR